MSLYNMLFGENPFSLLLLEVLGTSREKIPRYRDCFLSAEGDVVIHTRTGGGNRDYYDRGRGRHGRRVLQRPARAAAPR